MEIQISVRNLVEFLLRSGDIDNRKSGGADNAMLEGARLHRLLQSRMGQVICRRFPCAIFMIRRNTGLW